MKGRSSLRSITHRLLTAVIKMYRAGAGRSFTEDRFVDVACVDVSEGWSRRSATDWVVRDRLLVHLHIDLRATRPGSRDVASQGIVLEIHVRCPVEIVARRPKLVVRIPGEIHRSGGTGGTEVGREGSDVSFDVGRHVLAPGGQAVNAHASALTHRYVRR